MAQTRGAPPANLDKSKTVAKSAVGKSTILVKSKAVAKSTVGKSATSAKTLEHSHLTDHPVGYEVVRPPSQQQDTIFASTYGPSMVGRSMVAPSTSGTSRFGKSSRLNNKMSPLKVFILFTVVIVILVTLMVGGAFLVLELKKRQRDTVDKLLTTKMSICRAQHPEHPPECIYEVQSQYSECAPGPHCKRIRWTIRYTSEDEMTVDRADDTLNISTTEFSDCDVRKWCRSGRCVQKKTGWWQRKNNDVPFPEQSAAEAWQERSLYSDKITNIIPCLDSDKQTLDIAKMFITTINETYGSGEVCKKDICSTGRVRWALRFKFYHCDLPPPNPITGMRPRVCGTLPVTIFACHRCEKIEGQPVQPITQCHNRTYNGRECKTTSGGLGVCFYSWCYKIFKEKSAT